MSHESLLTLRELLAENEFSDDEVRQIRALSSGQHVMLGGGAAPLVKLLRVVDQRPRPGDDDAMFMIIDEADERLRLRIMRVLEANSSKCMDDESDRNELAIELVKELSS